MYCVIYKEQISNTCRKPATIRISIDRSVTFSICEDPECIKKLPDYFYRWFEKDTGYITIQVNNRTLKFPNDKRILNGVPTKILEVLNAARVQNTP